MDNQSLPPTVPTSGSAGTPPLSPSPNQPVQSPSAVGSGNVANKPTLAVSDKDVQSLLLVTGVSTKAQPKTKPHLKLLIAVAILIVLVALSSYFIGDIGPNGKLKQQNTTQSSGQSNEDSGQGIDNEINQDVKSCQNPAVAVSQC